MLTFVYGVDSNQCSEGLGFNHFYVESPCNPLEVKVKVTSRLAVYR
jgi:hypothetical protein